MEGQEEEEEEDDGDNENDNRIRCAGCGRKFNPESIEKHKKPHIIIYLSHDQILD